MPTNIITAAECRAYLATKGIANLPAQLSFYIRGSGTTQEVVLMDQNHPAGVPVGI